MEDLIPAFLSANRINIMGFTEAIKINEVSFDEAGTAFKGVLSLTIYDPLHWDCCEMLAFCHYPA